MKKLRVLMLMHEGCVPPDSIEGVSDEDMAAWKTEYDVKVSLHTLGHEVIPLPVGDELNVIRAAIQRHKPHVAFNLMEDFYGITVFDQHVVAYLELLRQPYTGCNPRGMMLTRDKGLCKKVLSYHRIRVPQFAVFARGRAVKRPGRLQFPLFVKSTVADSSAGIAQASIVHDDEKLRKRVEFIHEQLGTNAIAEEYIEGRELYVGVLGNRRLQTFPVWEMLFEKLADDVPHIATAKVKFDMRYQNRCGIRTQAAEDLPPGVEQRMYDLSRRAYRALVMSGYARMDFRLREDGRIYLLEANPNPHLAYGEDFAESAHVTGMKYTELIQRILSLGIRYRTEVLY
jgi:D-alanine-D-alanine ligase